MPRPVATGPGMTKSGPFEDSSASGYSSRVHIIEPALFPHCVALYRGIFIRGEDSHERPQSERIPASAKSHARPYMGSFTY